MESPQSSDTSPVREARPEDGIAIAAMLANAFFDDALMSYIFPDPGTRSERLAIFYSILFRGACDHGAVYTTPGNEAAALWRGPGHSRLSLLELLGEGGDWLRAARGDLPRALSVGMAIDAQHPEAAHWYLQVVGCEPAHQGKGYASAVIKAGIARASAEHLPCYLETAVPRNVGLYERLGFAVTRQWTIGTGMEFYGMWRP